MSARSSDRRITRRAAVGAVATATVLTASQARAQDQETPTGHGMHDPEEFSASDATPGASAPPVDTATPVAAELHEVTYPFLESSADGVLDTTLELAVSEVDMGTGHPVTTYTYNGLVPGATWEVRPGDSMRIHLVNNLPEIPEGQDPHDILRPHE